MDREHLLLRNGTWYVRIAIPRHLQSAVGKREIVRSLRTKSRATANRLKHGPISEIRGLIADAERAHGKELLRPEKHHPDPNVDALLSDLRLFRRQARMALMTPEELENAKDVLLDRAHALKDPDALTEETLKTAFRSLDDNTASTLSDAIDQYLEERKPPAVTQQTWNAKQRRLQELQDFVGGDRDIRRVNRQVAGRYVAENLQKRKLSVKTKKDILSDLSAFFGWAEVRGYTDSNPFWRMSGTLKTSTRGSEADTSTRRPWNRQELRTLLEDTDPTSSYWSMAVLALYTGMRLTELAETKLEDIHRTHIHIPSGKTKAAVRDVPLHPIIKPLVEHLKKTSTDGYLITGLKRGGEDNKRSHYFSKEFGKLIRDLGIEDKAVVFHGLRGNFITALEEANVPLNQVELLVGHTRNALAYNTYSGGVSLKQLIEAVKKVRYGKPVDELATDNFIIASNSTSAN